MKPTLIHMPTDLIEEIDARAHRENVSRSHLIRQAVSAFLSSEPREELASRVAQAYEDQPLSTADQWGDLESFLDAVRTERTAAN